MAADTLSPFVYWGQSRSCIYLKVDLKDIEKPNVVLDEDHVKFSAIGTGVQGRNNYSFSLDFYLPIDDKKSKYKVTDRHIEFVLEKVGVDECWPRVNYEQIKFPWLKVDFDKIFYDDDEKDSDEQEPMDSKKFYEELEKKISAAKHEAKLDALLMYLFFYNMFQWVGYCYVFIALGYHYCKRGEVAKKTAYDDVAGQLMVVQLGALLEVIHPLLKLTKTGILPAFVQCFGRNMILYLLIAQEPLVQKHEVVWYLFMTWSAIEIIRFPYYMMTLVKHNNGLITWLRYNLWIPLYPLGFILEGTTMLISLPLFKSSGKWSLTLPNAWNWSFSFAIFLQIYMIIFLPGGFWNMKYMYEQRKKKYPPKSIRKSANSKQKQG